MTITEDDLARLEALARRAEEMSTLGSHTWVRSDTGTTAEFLRAAPSVAALVAEVRQVRVAHEAAERHVLSLRKEYDRMYAEREEFRLKAKGFKGERDALRIENERLRNERSACNGSCDIALARRQVGPDAVVPSNARECAELWQLEAARLSVEASELRASLADAVAKIARMEPVVEAARTWRAPSGMEMPQIRGLLRAVDAYEASLPGIVKVGT